MEILNKEKILGKIRSISLSIPDRGSRMQTALEAEPRYMKLIRALCKEVGQRFDRVTAGDLTNRYKDTQILAWHFLTNLGHHYMIDYNGQAIMFSGESKEFVVTISVD